MSVAQVRSQFHKENLSPSSEESLSASYSEAPQGLSFLSKALLAVGFLITILWIAALGWGLMTLFQLF
jgi:hypothetical protein